MTQYRKLVAEKIERQLNNLSWEPEQKEQFRKQEEVVASLRLSDFLRYKLNQIAELIDELHIDARDLVAELTSYDVDLDFARPSHFFEALAAMLHLGVDKETVLTMFGFSSDERRILSEINQLRFTKLREFMCLDSYPAPQRALFAYRLPARAMLEYYEASKQDPELLSDPVFIFEHFFGLLDVPYAIVSREVIESREALKGYFSMQFQMTQQEYLGCYIFHYGLKRLLNEEVEESFVAAPSDVFTFRHVASGLVGEYLWLFFDATRQD